MLIVSGASQNHYKTAVQFLRSVDFNKCKCYFYDLGLSPDSAHYIKTTFNVNFRTFNYSMYPTYYNIHVNAGEYAWKPAIMAEVLQEIENSYTDLSGCVLMWCDAGNKFISDISPLYNHTLRHLIYTPTSSGNIARWTHIKTQQWFNIESDSTILEKPNRAGGVMAYAIGHAHVRDFIRELARCASIRDCIAPEGSSRTNHRQDQAVLSVMYYKFINTYNIPLCDRNLLCISIHNDID